MNPNGCFRHEKVDVKTMTQKKDSTYIDVFEESGS
jgi:hypothetical protein